MILGTRLEFRKPLMCCQGDFDKVSIRFYKNLVGSLIVLKYPFSFSVKLILPILFCMRNWRFRELGSINQYD